MKRHRSPYTRTMKPLLSEARAVLPDQLAGLAELGGRAVYATDGTYQRESAHYGWRTPQPGW